MQLRKERTAEEKRRRKGVDSFVKDIGGQAVEYAKGRIRDYPKEVTSGWKNFLGITKREIPETLEGIAPVGESVGGLAVSTTRALKQLGKSAVEMHRIDRILDLPKSIGQSRKQPERVRKVAAAIRQTPENILDHLIAVKYTDKLPFGVAGKNLRTGQPLGESQIQLAPIAEPKDWFHELTHVQSNANMVAARRAKGKPSLKQYMADLLETSTDAAQANVKKYPHKFLTKSGKKRRLYRDLPIEKHARLMEDVLTGSAGKKYTANEKQYNKLFIDAAKTVMKDVYKKTPTLYKNTAKKRAAAYKRVRKERAAKITEALNKKRSLQRKKGNLKKLTWKYSPGEMARAIQDAAEATGPPMYLRLKAD